MRVALIASLLWFVFVVTSGDPNILDILLISLGIPWGIYFIIINTRK